MNRKALAAVHAVLAFVLSTRVATAQVTEVSPRPPAESVGYSVMSFASVNPLTFGDFFEIRYERRLYETRSGALQRNFFAAAIAVAPSPFLAASARLELQPFSFLALAASYTPALSLLDTTQSSRSVNDAYRVDFAGLPRTQTSYSTSFQSLRLDGTIQAPIGPLFVRSASSATYTAAHLENDDTIYYNQFADLLLPARGWLFANDTVLGTAVTERLRLGVKSTLFTTFYPSDAYLPGEHHEPASATVLRVGPSFNWTLRDVADSVVGKVEVFGSLQWYLEDKYRTGAVVDAAIPYASVGLRISSVLWTGSSNTTR